MKRAATGWTIVAVVDDCAWLLGSGGKLVEIGAAGSFCVEAFAMEELVDNLLWLCGAHGVLDDSWKVESIPFSREELLEVKRI